MDHDHVRIAVDDGDPPGAEHVPARRLDDNNWELLRSPLYALGVASGDLVRILDPHAGTYEVAERGGNLSVQAYLSASERDDLAVTKDRAKWLSEQIESFGGRVDGLTPGLIVCTIPAGVGFARVESTFAQFVERHPGAEWQYCNVYDPRSGKPIGWWK